MDWQAIAVSLRLSFWTTVILLLVGTPIAYWAAFARHRWKFLVEAVVALPLVLPPTVLGFYVLVAIGPRSPFRLALRSAHGRVCCRFRSRAAAGVGAL